MSRNQVRERAVSSNELTDEKRRILAEYERNLVAQDLKSLRAIKKTEATQYSANPYVYYGRSPYYGINPYYNQAYNPLGYYGANHRSYPYNYYATYPKVRSYFNPKEYLLSKKNSLQSKEKMSNYKWYDAPFKGHRFQPSDQLLENTL